MTRAAMMGVLLGVVLSCGVICVMTIMDDTLKTEEDITKYLGISTLSSVPDRRDYINVKKSRHGKQEERERHAPESGSAEGRSRERRERRSIIFHPSTDKVEKYFTACDAAVFPSTLAHQARPIYEAGAAEIPIFISDFENTKEFVTEENGYCFQVNNAEELAERIPGVSTNTICPWSQV